VGISGKPKDGVGKPPLEDIRKQGEEKWGRMAVGRRRGAERRKGERGFPKAKQTKALDSDPRGGWGKDT